MKNNTTLATAVAVSLTLIGSTLCHALTRAERIEMEFNKLDLDKSGSLTLEEFTFGSKTPAQADQQFARIDSDKDGLIIIEEFMAFKNRAPKK